MLKMEADIYSVLNSIGMCCLVQYGPIKPGWIFSKIDMQHYIV